MKKRDKLHKDAVDSNSHAVFDEYRKLRNEINNDIRTCKEDYVLDMINGENVKEGNIWKAVDVVRCKNKKVPVSNNITSDQMNNYYAHIGENLASVFPDSPSLWKGASSIHEFIFKSVTISEILNQLSLLENKSKNDVLDMDSRLLYLSRFVIATSLTTIINKSIITGVVPAGKGLE
jgi:hypothetical protein